MSAVSPSPKPRGRPKLNATTPKSSIKAVLGTLKTSATTSATTANHTMVSGALNALIDDSSPKSAPPAIPAKRKFRSQSGEDLLVFLFFILLFLFLCFLFL